MRLIGGGMLALTVWPGLPSGGVLRPGNLILAPRTLPTRGKWFDLKRLLIIGLNAVGC